MKYKTCVVGRSQDDPDPTERKAASLAGFPTGSDCGLNFWYLKTQRVAWVYTDRVDVEAELGQYHRDDIDILLEYWIRSRYTLERRNGVWKVLAYHDDPTWN